MQPFFVLPRKAFTENSASRQPLIGARWNPRIVRKTVTIRFRPELVVQKPSQKISPNR